MTLFSDRSEPAYRVSGDTAVEITTPSGDLYSVRYVGIGHPWHTVGPKGGRVSTGTEYLLAKALIAESESRRVATSRKQEPTP